MGQVDSFLIDMQAERKRGRARDIGERGRERKCERKDD